jgi:hypothetical protein
VPGLLYLAGRRRRPRFSLCCCCFVVNR